MTTSLQTTAPRRRADIPLNVRDALVESLYGPVASALAAYVMVPFVGAVLTWRTGGNPWLLGITAASALLSCFRIRALLVYRARRAAGPLAADEIDRWERVFERGAIAFSILLGLLSAAGVYTTDDRDVHVILVGLAIAFAASVAGRNAALQRMVMIQIMVTLLPVVVALTATLDGYYAFFGATLLIFVAGYRDVARNLSAMLMKAMLTGEHLATSNARLGTALSNMSHGLAMFDARGRFVLGNSRFLSLLGLPQDAALEGSTIWQVLASASEASAMDGAEAEAAAGRIHERDATGSDDEILLAMADGRHLSARRGRQDADGFVLILDDVTERLASEARMRFLATRDGLTGVLNRGAFIDVVEKAVSGRKRLAIHYIDLDRFKAVNDTMGHPAGDALLVQVAARLRGVAGENDAIARLGGDEFVVAQMGCGTREEAEALARTVVSVLSKPFDIEGRAVRSGGSVGVALGPLPGQGAGALIRDADAALYRAKGRRGSFHISGDEDEASTGAEIHLLAPHLRPVACASA